MKIYNITKGQLITSWIFGIIAWIAAFFQASDYDSTSGGILVLFIPFALVFYTIGWKNRKKKDEAKKSVDKMTEELVGNLNKNVMEKDKEHELD